MSRVPQFHGRLAAHTQNSVDVFPPVPIFARPGGGKKRDPGNEVGARPEGVKTFPYGNACYQANLSKRSHAQRAVFICVYLYVSVFTLEKAFRTGTLVARLTFHT